MSVHRHAAALSLPEPMDGTDHGVTLLDVFIDIGPEFIEHCRPESPHLMNGSAALHDARLIGSVRQILKLGVGGEYLEEGVDIACVEGGVPALHDFDVLLRHRPRSIARRAWHD